MMAGVQVKEMHEIGLGVKMDELARPELMALAKDANHVSPAKTDDDLGFRTGRLDDNDLPFGTFF